jgi:hypothetical protein
MAELVLKNIDESLMRYLTLAAQTTGRTVEQVAARAIEKGIRLDIEARVGVADYIKSMQPGPIEEDSTDIIRRLRDAS